LHQDPTFYIVIRTGIFVLLR